jgi:hypothetical protein
MDVSDRSRAGKTQARNGWNALLGDAVQSKPGPKGARATARVTRRPCEVGTEVTRRHAVIVQSDGVAPVSR